MKRVLSFLMALVMCLSLVPEAAFAQELYDPEAVFQEEAALFPEIEEEPAFEETEEMTSPLEETEESVPETEPTQETEEPSVSAEETMEAASEDMLVITEEPEDTLLAEGTAFFYVSAAVCQDGIQTEALPDYQWQSFESEVWQDLPGQTDQVLVLEGLTQVDVGSTYRCRVTYGDLEAVSLSAQVTGVAEEPDEEVLWETDTFINPIYEDVLTEDDLPQISPAETYAEYTRYESQEEAAQAMKQALKNRQPSFSAEFYLEDAVPMVPAAFMRPIYYMAVEHTGVPTEGDYMHFEFGGYRGKYSWEEKTRVFRCTYNFLYYTTAEQEEAVDAEVARLLTELDLANLTPKARVDTIYDYLCSTVTYDYKNLNNQSNTLKYTAYAALINHTAVCQGYATAFYRLCLESGVDAREISSNSMNHAWNIVNLGAFYYCLDATWDAGHQSNYRYYLKGRKDWTVGGKNGMNKHEMGNEFQDASFEERYPVPEENYEDIAKGFALLEDGTLVILSQEVPNYQASWLNGRLTTNAPWREVAEDVRKIQFPDGITGIGSNAFQGLTNLEELVLPDTLQVIESHAFEGCTNLKELTIPTGVNAIGSGAFQNCTGLKTLAIRSGPRMDTGAFSGCNIETLTLPAEWNAYALEGSLDHLKTLIFTGGGYMASYSASDPAPWSGTGVETVRFDSELQKIGDYGFKNCRNIENLELPQNLRLIGASSFEGCEGLEKLCLPVGLSQIGASAFSGCGKLKTLIFTGKIRPRLDSGVFRGDTMTCVYPCAWQPRPTGNYSGTVTWKTDHSLEYVPPIPVAQDRDGNLEHWKCAQCGRLFADETGTGEVSAEDVTLYRDVYPIVYEGLEDGENPNPSGYPSAQGLTLKDAVRTGYLFEGWYKDSGFQQRVQTIAPLTHEALTLYAKWTPIRYTLAFHSNGGSGSAPKVTLDYDRETVLPSGGFRRTGYTLSGWNTAKDGSGDSFAPGQSVRALTTENKKTVTLYAQWTPVTYTVRLVPNDGITEAMEQPVLYGENFVFPTDLGSKEGWHISKWTSKSNGTGTGYGAGKTVKNLSSTEKTLIFYGKWEPNTYTVVFHSNGGSGKDKKQTLTYGKTAHLSANSFSRTGYLFAGWSMDPDGNADFANKQRLEASLTAEQGGVVDLYAVWTPISYKVAFKANGAVGTMASTQWTYGQEYPLPEMTFQRPGFTFLGWGTSAAGKARYEDGQEVENLASVQGRTVTLYALWKAHSYEIRFTGGEGTTGTTRAMTKLSCGRTYTLNANGFKKTGYDFAGWLGANGEEYPNRDKGMNFVLEDGGVLELEAQWAHHPYTITYKNCIAYDQTPTLARYDVENHVTFEEPIRAGTEFLGWYLDSRCTKPIHSTEGRTGNLTVYAKWGAAPKYTVHFEGGDGTTGKTADMTGLTCGKVYSLRANGFKKTGYSFTGWSLTPEGKKRYNNKEKIGNLWQENGKPITLYALWTPISYKITYSKTIAADENPNPSTFTVKDRVILAAPVRPGCEFLGWYRESSFKNRVTEITPGSRAANLTLYAKWENSGRGFGYTIAFDGNGATSGKTNPMTGRRNGTMYTLTANGFRRPGYTFLGWSLDENAQVPTWKNRATVGNLAEHDKETVTLYAVWKKQ